MPTFDLLDHATGELVPTDPTLDLSAYGFEPTVSGLSPTREVSFKEWAALEPLLRCEMQTVTRRATWIQFAFGDWLNYGESHFGGESMNTLDPAHYDFHTLNNFKSVARRVPPSRRRENLTYYHHSTVAKLLPDEQTKWLDEAEREGLSGRALYERVNAEKGIAPAEPYTVTCPKCQAVFTP